MSIKILNNKTSFEVKKDNKSHVIDIQHTYNTHTIHIQYTHHVLKLVVASILTSVTDVVTNPPKRSKIICEHSHKGNVIFVYIYQYIKILNNKTSFEFNPQQMVTSNLLQY